MARKDIINQNGVPNWDAIAGFKERLDDHDGSLAQNTSRMKSLFIDVVKDYNADPTGATDSTTAIQNALNAAQNGAIYFPNGTYLTSSALVVPSPIRIEFATHMTTIKFVGTGDAVQIYNQKHVYWNKGTVDISGADANAVAIHVGGLWYGTFISPRTVKGGANSVGILIDSSKPNGTHWGAYIIRIQDYESNGAGFADLQTRQAAGDTGDITHLTVDGGWTIGGTYGCYLEHLNTGTIQSITHEGPSNPNTGSGVYVGTGSTDVYIMGLGEIDNYLHRITVDGATEVYVYGDNNNGSNQDVNIINSGTAHRIGTNMVRMNPKVNYAVELHSDFNYTTSMRLNAQGGSGNTYDVVKWGENVGMTLSGGAKPVIINSPMTFTPMTSSVAVNGSLFVDSADNKLKYKDSSGTVNLLY